MTKLTRHWWVFLLLWALPIASHSQTLIDKTKQKLEAATRTSDKMSLNFQFAELIQRKKPITAIYHARQTFGFAQEIENKSYQRRSAILLGKLFINQGDETNARIWLNTALQLGKSHNEGSTVIEAATLLSGFEVRKNNYKRAYELNLAALNYINRNKNSLSQLDKEYAQRKRNLEKELRNIQAEIDKLNVSVETYQNDPSEELTTADITPTIEIVKDTILLSDTIYTEVPVPTNSVQRSALFSWLSAGLGLLSLALLGGLYYFWNKRQEEKEEFEHQLLKKERLLRNYQEEIEENERLKNQSSFANGKYQKAKRIDPLSILILDIGSGRSFEDHPDDHSFVASQQKLWADLNLIVQLYPAVFYLKKIGTTLIFGSGLNTSNHEPDQLLSVAKDLREYLEGKNEFFQHAKMAIHTGPVMVSTLDLNRESLDIVGHTFDQCSWMISKASPGQIVLSESTQSLLNNKDRIQLLSEGNDFAGDPIRLYEIPY